MSKAPYVGLHVRASGRRTSAADIVASVVLEQSSGALPAGARLPPVRALAQQLGSSKNTVQSAYDELVARGVVDAREREGMFVAAASARAAITPLQSPPLPRVVPSPMTSVVRTPPGVLAMSNVFIDGDLLPSERLAECTRAVLRGGGYATFYDAQGHAPLREAIAARLVARGLDVEPGEVVITTGSQQALDIVGRSLSLRRIAVEDPVYAYARILFQTLGAEVLPLRLDPFDGIDMDAWTRALAIGKPSLLYAISSFQNPTGYSYSSSEIAALLAACAAHGVAILEDDWGSDMLSGGEYRPTLRALGGKHVLYVNSFTKKLLPSLRVGFVVAHPSLVPTLVAMKRVSTLGNAWIGEAVVAEFLARGYYDTHLASVQGELDRRYRACLDALDETMPEGVRWTRPGGGPTLWLELPRAVDLVRLERDLAGRSVSIQCMQQHFAGAPHLHGFRLGYASMPAPALRRGLEAIAAAVGAQLP